MNRARRELPRRRGGMTAVIAMLFLVLIGALALGFIATSNTATQSGRNHRDKTEALSAAESGMQFMKYQLSQIAVPAGTSDDALDDMVFAALGGRLNGSNNLHGGVIAMSGGHIEVPASTSEFIFADDRGTRFRASLMQAGREMRVAVTGFAGDGRIGTGVTMNFKIRQRRSPILDYGVAARGALDLSSGFINGAPVDEGSVFTASTLANPLQIAGTAAISGTVAMTNSAGAISGSGSIGGTTDPSDWVPPLVTNNAPMPEFPTVDPSPFVDYLVGKETLVTGNVSGGALANIRVKAGCNAQFSGGTIDGVVLVEAPNQITFSGGCIIHGVIVVANPEEATSTNKVSFSGNSSITGVESLPDIDPYKTLRTMSGSALLAPQFAVVMSGGASSFGGAVVCKSVVLSGGSGGSVAGTVIVTGNSAVSLSGGSGFTMTPGASGIPAGLTFGGIFAPRYDTWREQALVNGVCPLD